MIISNIFDIFNSQGRRRATAAATEFIMATGGTVTTQSIAGSDYALHRFLSTGSGSFTVSRAGSPTSIVTYLVVAGGGAGADNGGGGGGAGGMLTGSISGISTITYPVVVGAGGTAVNNDSGNNGADSSFYNVTASGGGGGGTFATAGKNGGSGGGGGGVNGTISGGTGIAGQGRDGGAGNGGGTTASRGAGGGGGAGAIGEAGNTDGSGTGGDGGDGLQSDITGIATYYAGGGGGWAGADSAGNPGTGGQGGGGTGGRASAAATAGSANTGGGGGGDQAGTGTAGGSGVVMLRYPIQKTFPLTAITGCIANWRADAGVTWDGTKVTNWQDQSGFGWHLSGTSGPTTSSMNSDFNNHPTLNFNGSSQFLVSDYVPQNGGSGADQTGTTFVVVMKQKRQTSFEIIFFWGEADTTKNRLSTGNAGDANKFRMDVSFSGSNPLRQMHTTFNTTSSYNVMTSYNKVTNGNMRIYMNGVETTNGAATLSNKVSEGRFTMGRQVDSANYSQMEVAEAAVFKVDLYQHPAAFQQVLQYVTNRYGIASGSI